MARSAWGVRVSVSVALLLAGLGSVTPAGGATLAVLSRVPVADGLIWTVKVKVTLAPTGRSTVVARAPLPPVGPLTLPPPLLAVVVQLAAVPPSVLVRARSAWGVRVSVSLSLLLARLGSVTPAGGATLAVLVRVPVAAGSMVPVSVMVTDCPAARLSPLQIPVTGS